VAGWVINTCSACQWELWLAGKAQPDKLAARQQMICIVGLSGASTVQGEVYL
jgi:hypothetical protein